MFVRNHVRTKPILREATKKPKCAPAESLLVERQQLHPRAEDEDLRKRKQLSTPSQGTTTTDGSAGPQQQRRSRTESPVRLILDPPTGMDAASAAEHSPNLGGNAAGQEQQQQPQPQPSSSQPAPASATPPTTSAPPPPATPATLPPPATPEDTSPQPPQRETQHQVRDASASRWGASE